MSLNTYAPDPQLLRETFGHFPSGVAALAAEVDGVRHVLVASSFTVGVSLEPPLVMFAVQNSSSTWPGLRAAERIGISILGAGHGQLCRQLAGRDKSARFAGIEAVTGTGGAVFIPGAPVWFECSVYDEHPAGDHQVIFFQIHALHADKGLEPLVFHGSRFRQLAAA
ncbi:flavin reductase family protein [Arthrobacter sp. I2-34]|uniref:Flavin reductase family protein n=1 Tax=Arthrobacter hankyongi TaxID=2904801 RepID=A0ABS9LDQ2_9MICC|nr:flavin reductase family protein [Arthrobacter hankyongi]MCG2624805.1 flavin reductase family protein [Arthrobacter hankyongi]